MVEELSSIGIYLRDKDENKRMTGLSIDYRYLIRYLLVRSDMKHKPNKDHTLGWRTVHWEHHNFTICQVYVHNDGQTKMSRGSEILIRI